MAELLTWPWAIIAAMISGASLLGFAWVHFIKPWLHGRNLGHPDLSQGGVVHRAAPGSRGALRFSRRRGKLPGNLYLSRPTGDSHENAASGSAARALDHRAGA